MVITAWLLLLSCFNVLLCSFYDVKSNTIQAAPGGYIYGIWLDLNLDGHDLSNLDECSDNITYDYNGTETTKKIKWSLSTVSYVGGVEANYLNTGDEVLGLIAYESDGVSSNVNYIYEATLNGLVAAINNISTNKKFIGFNIIAPTETTATVSETGSTFNFANSNKESIQFLNFTTTGASDWEFNGYVLQAQWENLGYEINYYDEGGSEFSGAHESNYATTHTNGTTTQLDTPTKDGYTFAGWYDNAECTGSPITELSASTTYSGAINLYAKWTSNDITLTFTCTNYSNQNYFIYIYEGENIKYQMYVQGQATVKLSYSDKQYKIQFVLSYLGSVSYSVNGSATQNNKTITLTEVKDTSITYQIKTANITNTIII